MARTDKAVEFCSVYEDSIYDPNCVALEYDCGDGVHRIYLNREDAISLRDGLSTVISGTVEEQA